MELFPGTPRGSFASRAVAAPTTSCRPPCCADSNVHSVRESSRHGIFMKMTTVSRHWTLETCSSSCPNWRRPLGAALENGKQFKTLHSRNAVQRLREKSGRSGRARRRAVTYALHLRETNLGKILRQGRHELKLPNPQKRLSKN